MNLGQSVGVTDVETHCILKAFLHLKRNLPNSKYRIFPDSNAGLQRIVGKTNHLTHQIQNSAKSCILSIDWCPAHLEIEGNELVDPLSKGATNKKPFKRDIFTSHPFLKQKSKDFIVKEWKRDRETEFLREE